MANLQRFEQEWEHRRLQKSKQVARREEEPSKQSATDQDDFWWQLCRNSLETQHYQRLTTNPLTVGEGVAFELEQIYVPLGLVERKQQDKRSQEITPDKGSRLYEVEENEVTPVLALDEFLESLLKPEPQKRIALAGEPGAGKTTLLQKIAAWLLQHQVLPIWISLADLQGETLEQYLLQTWLKSSTATVAILSSTCF